MHRHWATIYFIIGAVRYSGSSDKAMCYNHSVDVGWCSSTHRPLCETRVLCRHFSESSAGTFLHLGLLDPPTGILETFGH
ncbi:hypothetical protein TNCV_3992271 [Trichonephila clavipes]|uniref:Uncharacterized protein n=1 Tax=Trichonephila clavipes TaxID=2585209 RepID=A0A8X6T876_TRICX|nr:hypothetical protein TNCV_3992271 [Trichonephila clavipes]